MNSIENWFLQFRQERGVAIEAPPLLQRITGSSRISRSLWSFHVYAVLGTLMSLLKSAFKSILQALHYRGSSSDRWLPDLINDIVLAEENWRKPKWRVLAAIWTLPFWQWKRLVPSTDKIRAVSRIFKNQGVSFSEALKMSCPPRFVHGKFLGLQLSDGTSWQTNEIALHLH